MQTDAPELPERSFPRPAASSRSAAPAPVFILGLRGKIVLFSVLLAALPLLVSSLSMIDATRGELKSVVNDRLIAAAGSLMDEIRLTLEPALQTLSLLRAGLDHLTLPVEGKVALLHSGVEDLQGLEALQLVVAGRPPVYLFKQRFKARLDRAEVLPAQGLAMPVESVSALQAQGGVEVGEPFYLSGLDAWLLPLSVRLREPIAGQESLLVAYLDLGELRRGLAGRDFVSGGGVWLLGPQGAPLFSGDRPPPAAGLAALGREPPTTPSGTVVVAPFRTEEGAAMLVAVGVMENPPWTVLVAASEQQAYAAVDRMQHDLVFWLALGMAAAIVGAWVLANRIAGPIRQMARVTRRVGRGDFRVSIQGVARRDEIGALAQQLNFMIRGLAESHQRLDHLAHHDSLTGLPNRRMVLEHLPRALDEARHGGERVALLFLDLDRFKNVNDSLGHAVGDRLLVKAAARLRACLGEGEMAARLGGDEFLVVVRDVRDRQAVAAIATRLIGTFAAPFQLLENELYVGLTIGISLIPDDGFEVAELIGKSDMAMYRAKEEGRGHYRFFDADLKSKAVRKLSLDGRLRRAVDGGLLEVYYQPQVDIERGRIVATEALLRWPDQQGGFVASPSEFIPLAEETGLIVALGDWVMDSVCRQTRAWHLAGLPKVSASVNVSAIQFRRPDFFRKVRQCLEGSHLDAGYLGLELTEGVLLEDTRRSFKLMSEIKEMGIQVLIDDFGTGYSSLAYLRRLPIDYVKVAQEFVMGIGSNQNDAMIVGAVIALARSLGLKTIAEGVENSDQLAFLAQRHCDLIQGYYFGRPLSAERFQCLLGQEARLGPSGSAPLEPCD